MDSDQAADTTKETVNDKVTTSDVNNNRLSLSSGKRNKNNNENVSIIIIIVISIFTVKSLTKCS